MIRLLEYQAKRLLKEAGVPIPEGDVARTSADAARIAAELGRPVAVKAQVPVGARGKAGGILFADDPEGARKAARKLLGSRIRGETVRKVLVEEKLDIAEEWYVSITLDRAERRPVLLVSREGGVDIEEVPDKKIARRYLDPILGLRPFEAREAILEAGIPKEHLRDVEEVITSMYEVFDSYDAHLVEINPLVLTEDGGVVAADAVVNLDEDAANIRHPEFAEETRDFPFVELDGDIGIIANGAGLTMATIDLVKDLGGEPANFLDVGGGAYPTLIRRAILTVAELDVKVILLNIFGGITRCDEVAEGIVQALDDVDVPLVVRLVGTNEEEGHRILREHGVDVYTELKEAVERAVELAGV
ncbi:ADP-forming succinate--CoA ligase subunit beta [Methanopyrus kandleri]